MAALSIAEFTAHCSQIPPSLDQATIFAAFQRACVPKSSSTPATTGSDSDKDEDVDARCAEMSSVKLDSAREDLEKKVDNNGTTMTVSDSNGESALANEAAVSSTTASSDPVVGGEPDEDVPAFGELHADSLIEFALVDDPAAPGMSKGFGFATFESTEERDAFIESLNGALLSDVFGAPSLPGNVSHADGSSSSGEVGEEAQSADAMDLGGDGARLVVAPAKAKKAPAPKKKKKSSAEQDEHVKGLSGGRQWLSKGKKGKATPKHSPTLSTDTNRRYSKCN